ncbi:hypothetical protein L1049_019872 [Liquidambar formosana]|uniref:LIM domain protein n=1 Tax=Liquidambar formosana TaxID=63359 RepID=A0AAP0SCA1_LIQFO
MAEPIDFSQTQRIVLLIDLNPLLHLQNPNPYLTSILTTSQTLLTFPPLSSTLFAFKLFFSSLSPLLSSSKLPKPSLSLSFDHPPHTLTSLSKTLNSLSTTLFDESSAAAAASPPLASLTASSLRQLVHEYAWEYQIQDPSGTAKKFPIVRSNLVLLFSPICKSLMCLSEYMNVEMDNELLMNVGAFCKKFCGFFDSVNDAFVSRDIHVTWVNVNFEDECSKQNVWIDESELQLGFFANAIKGLGWGFCSTDSIVLGSAIVPFGLIYPIIGVSSNLFDCDDFCKKNNAQLSLQISDVSRKPLECKCCDLDLIDLKMLPRNRSNDVLQAWEFMNSKIECDNRGKTFWGQFGVGIMKLHIKAVQRYDEHVKIEGRLSDMILVRGILDESGKDRKESFGDLFADRVLEMLMIEMGEFTKRKSVPIWQILLSFLHREGYWALVSLSNGNGDSCMGILRPFTVHSALLSIIDNRLYPHSVVHDVGGLDLVQFVTKTNKEIPKSNVAMNHSNGFIGSQSGTMASKNYVALGDDKRKKKTKNSHLYQDLTWSSFCKAAFGHSRMDLEEIYFSREGNSSKKLKFLKCWMKQIKKSCCCSLIIPDGSKLHQDIPKEIEERLTGLHQESEQPISSSASAGEDSLTGASRIQDETALDFCSETSEVFFSNLCKKIQDGLESNGVDLGALAERLVRSSVHWLYQKHEIDTTSESQIAAINSDDTCGSMAAGELTKLLLREPKDLSQKHKNNNPSSQAADPMSTGFTSEHIVREYELQILFRMEILRSEVAVHVEESTRQRFVKQICLLLDSIQCHLEGGFFGDWSLNNYVGRIIKSRYSHTLGDVVHRIYTKMDLLLFGEEDESPNSLLNSEDSNQSWRDKQGIDEMGGNGRINVPVLADESLQQLENDNWSPQGIKQVEHARKLIEAQESRKRARRFASFTSWVPDLQRVWAPKQLKPMRSQSDTLQKLSKRKDRQRATYDTVCETPMTGKKRSCSRGSCPGDEHQQDYGINSCSSVSKALFQNDG